MDEKEKRDREELRRQLKNLTFTQKLEYFWMYYKWVIVIVIGVIALAVGLVGWLGRMKETTVLFILAENAYEPSPTAEDEIKEAIGSTDPDEKTDIRTTVVVNPETGELDYYSNMAFLAIYMSGELDMVLVPDYGLEKMRENVEKASLEEIFGEDAPLYKEYEAEEGVIRLPEGCDAERLLGLPYSPAYVMVASGCKNMENVAAWLVSLLKL